MIVDRVRVTFGTTRNLGDYNSLKLELALEAGVEEGEDALVVARELHERAAAELKAQYALRRPPARGQREEAALSEPDPQWDQGAPPSAERRRGATSSTAYQGGQP